MFGLALDPALFVRSVPVCCCLPFVVSRRYVAGAVIGGFPKCSGRGSMQEREPAGEAKGKVWAMFSVFLFFGRAFLYNYLFFVSQGYKVDVVPRGDHDRALAAVNGG